MKCIVKSDDDMRVLGARLGAQLQGGDVIELIGDIGAGKTTLVKGIARGLAIDDTVQSPTFTISRVYTARDGLELVHYDFYRLTDAGIMAAEIAERLNDGRSIVAIEWAATVQDTLPLDRLTIKIVPLNDETRSVAVTAHGSRSKQLEEVVA